MSLPSHKPCHELDTQDSALNRRPPTGGCPVAPCNDIVFLDIHLIIVMIYVMRGAFPRVDLPVGHAPTRVCAWYLVRRRPRMGVHNYLVKSLVVVKATLHVTIVIACITFHKYIS